MFHKHFSTLSLIAAGALMTVGLIACGASPQATNTPAPTVEAALTAEATVEATAEATIESAATAEVTSEATVESTAESTREATAETTQAAAVEVACVKLDLNTLTEDQLMTNIPNFSSRMVREFFEYRPYVSIQQFRREIGKYVDETQVAEYEQYVYVPVVPNDADADTLMQIPGVDEALANTLIEGRPYADNQAFLDALAGELDSAQLAEAACYVAADA